MPRLRHRLLAFALFLLVFPFFLRRRPRVERRITICATPEEIFPFLNDLRNWPLWSPWARREEIEFSYGGQFEGVGAVQRWRGAKISGVTRVVRSDVPERIDYEVEVSGGKYQLLGRFLLTRDGECTRVAWRCVWEPALNPYMRYFDLFLRWMLSRDFTAGLQHLKTAVETRREQPAEA